MKGKLLPMLILSAGLLGTGCPWDFMQTIAWVRMFNGYAQSMTFAQAVKKTFSGDEACGMCRMIEAARHDVAKSAAIPAERLPEKLLFISSVRRVIYSPRNEVCTNTLRALSLPASAERAAPPVPPPRASA
jgi:hypothetical protein